MVSRLDHGGGAVLAFASPDGKEELVELPWRNASLGVEFGSVRGRKGADRGPTLTGKRCQCFLYRLLTIPDIKALVS